MGEKVEASDIIKRTPDEDGMIYKEVSYMIGTDKKEFKSRCPVDTCMARNCTKRGRFMILPILSKHDPFWLCNTHYKRFKRSIFEQRTVWREKSKGHQLLWVRNDAEIVPKGTKVNISLNLPKPTRIEVYGAEGWEGHDVKAIHQNDEVYVPLDWITESSVFDVIIKVADKEKEDEPEVRDNIDEGEPE